MNEDNITAVCKELVVDYKTLVDHHFEEVVLLQEEYGADKLEIAHHLHQYKVDRKVTRLQPVETMELSDNPTEGLEPAPVTQGEPSTTPTAPNKEPTTGVTLAPTPRLTPEPTLPPIPTPAMTTTKPPPQLEPYPTTTTEPMPQPNLTPKPTMRPPAEPTPDPEPPLKDTIAHLRSDDTTQTHETETVVPELPPIEYEFIMTVFTLSLGTT